MTMKTSSEVANREVLAALSGRDEILATMLHGMEIDDGQLAVVERFQAIYGGWSQLDKDIWYVCTTRSISECARLMQVSRRLIDEKYKELCKQLN